MAGEIKASGLVPEARGVANPDGNRDRSCVCRGRTHLLSTGFTCVKSSCLLRFNWVCRGYVTRLSAIYRVFLFLFFSLLSPVDMHH